MQFACSSHVVDTYHSSVVLMCDMKDKACLSDLFYFLFFDSSLLFFFCSFSFDRIYDLCPANRKRANFPSESSAAPRAFLNNMLRDYFVPCSWVLGES